MGSLSDLMGLMPNFGGRRPNVPSELDEAELGRFEAILSSMTIEERLNASLINGSRRRRIARGSGCAVSDVNRLLRRFTEARQMLKTLKSIKSHSKGKLEKMMSRLR
jgi:signal recognition particle subunit SRP54